MDDLGESVSEVLKNLQIWLTTDLAFHVYSWLAIIAILALSALAAVCLLLRVRGFNQTDILEIIPGKMPKKNASIKRRIARSKAFAASAFMTVARNAAALIFVGMIVPGGLLGVIAAQQNWFMPGTFALTLDGVPTQSTAFSHLDFVLFVIDQSLRGSLTDTFEVFDLALTNVRANPDNYLFSSLVLFYRILSGLVFAAVVFVSFRIAFAVPLIRKKIQVWEAKLNTQQFSPEG